MAENEWSITYKQLGVISASFAIGAVTVLLAVNSNVPATTNFSTTELIGFVLTVILSGASIVLAISAIALGKLSEKAIIDRSDESIRLQNEVFQKTTDALQRIESSTGVTEKRIEDIISGRVGDLSQTIAEIATEEAGKGKEGYRELEKTIRETITQSIRQGPEVAERQRDEERREKMKERRAQRLREREEYQELHDKFMIALANRDDLKILKSPQHGGFNERGLDFFDAVFVVGEKKLGVSTLEHATSEDEVQMGLLGATREIREDTVDLYLNVIFNKEDYSPAVIDDLVSGFNKEYSSRMLVKGLGGDEINGFVKSLDFSNNKIQVTQ